MTLPGVPGLRLLAAPSGSPIATVPALREVDGVQVWLLLVTAELEPSVVRRVRAECTELEAMLTRIDPALVLPLLDHGVDGLGRLYLLAARPGPELDTVAMHELGAAARALEDGLGALAAQGIVGPPPPLVRHGSRIVLGTPLPPILADLQTAHGPGTGHEPPEVLGGGDWTAAGQVYACASVLWKLLCGHLPFGSEPLARLVQEGTPRLHGVPEGVETALQKALSADPSQRPARLAEMLRDAGARPLGSLYLLDAEIGQGATGVVWAGRRRADGGPVAVKLLRAEFDDDDTALERFVREFTVLRRLRHPHLVRVHDFVKEGGVYAIVMDLVEGENLRQIVQRGRLSVPEAAQLLAQTASGLAAVHEAGVVHRDVKPENVLVTQRDGRRVALLSDFGISRPVEGSSRTQVIGTPAYFAPELAAGRPPTYGADVYALGVMAYEMLAGRKPFEGANPQAIMHAHIDQLPARMEGLADDVWQLVADCLEKAPEARPAAAAVADRWAMLAGSEPLRAPEIPTLPPASYVEATPVPQDTEFTILSARPAPPEPEPPRPKRWRRLVIAAVTVGVLGVATGITFNMLSTKDIPVVETAPSPSPLGQYPVAANISLNGSVATIEWRDSSELAGFQGYLVFHVGGDHPIPLTRSMLGPDITSYEVTELRPGREECFYVIAVGVTVPPPQQVPPFPCVTRPSPKR